MELTCDACHTIIQIPAERVPPNVTFRITCPRCKEKIIASPKRPELTGAGMGGFPPTAEPAEVTAPVADTRDELLAETFEPSKPGQRTALVCMDDAEARAHIKSTLESMGYAVDTPPTPQHALHRLRFSQWHVVVLEDSFGGMPVNPVACYLAPLDMSMRRETFVVLVSERLKTFNHLQAFVNSVSLVLHPADQMQFATILEQALADHDRFYRVFNECLVAAGKKAHSR